jgi:UDP-N-acetylmuramoylalanine-D-glutamate ligase
LFTGVAGKRMMQEFVPMKKPGQEVFFEERFIDLARCLGSTPQGKACLLSPAASSYDQFQDFEARGRVFKKMAENLAVSCHEK